MHSILFEYATAVSPSPEQTGRTTAHGLKHLVAVEHPLTPSKLLAAELQFLIWFQGNAPGKELLDWAAKDPGSGRVFSQYRSEMRKILDLTEMQRERARSAGDGGPYLTIVES